MNNTRCLGQMRKAATIGAAALALSFCSQGFFVLSASADAGYGYGDYKPITNGDFFANSQPTAELLRFNAEWHIKINDPEGAIPLLRKSLEGNDDDIDSHKFLAVALELKLKKQAEKDPSMYAECVHEWLIVLRNERGPEKGLGLKNGISPGIGNGRFDDEDGALMARAHLIKLTGSQPKRRETDKQYLARVLQPASSTVSGKVLNNRHMVDADQGGEFSPL